MQRLEVSGAVRLIYNMLGVKELITFYKRASNKDHNATNVIKWTHKTKAVSSKNYSTDFDKIYYQANAKDLQYMERVTYADKVTPVTSNCRLSEMIWGRRRHLN